MTRHTLKLIRTSGNVIPRPQQGFHTEHSRRPSPTLPSERCHRNMPRWFNICLLHAFAGRHVIKQEATAAPALINHRPWRTIMPGPSEATDYTHCLIKTAAAEGNSRVFLFIGLVSFAAVRLTLLNDLARWWNDASIEFTGGEGAVPIISGVSPHWTPVIPPSCQSQLTSPPGEGATDSSRQ